MRADRHSVERDFWGGVAFGFVAAAGFVLYATVAKRRPARTTTPQGVSTGGEDDDRNTGYNIIAYPRNEVSGPGVLEAIHELLCDAIDELEVFHDHHSELASQLNERQFALAKAGLEDVVVRVGYLLQVARDIEE